MKNGEETDQTPLRVASDEVLHLFHSYTVFFFFFVVVFFFHTCLNIKSGEM